MVAAVKVVEIQLVTPNLEVKEAVAAPLAAAAQAAVADLLVPLLFLSSPEPSLYAGSWGSCRIP